MELHFPFHNYAGPGTHVIERIQKGDLPINDFDAAALIHDMEYIGYGSRNKADLNMMANIAKSGKPFLGLTAFIAFKADQLLLGERAVNRPDVYNENYDKANLILERYGYHSRLKPISVD